MSKLNGADLTYPKECCIVSHILRYRCRSGRLAPGARIFLFCGDDASVQFQHDGFDVAFLSNAGEE